jgi:hypothetical protein
MFAEGDGLDYCIDVERLNQTGVMRICREWNRLPVGPGVRNADVDDLPEEADVPERMVSMLGPVFREQEIEDEWPSFDRLLIGIDGRIWVRTIGAEQPDVHPWIISYAPSLQPTHRSWDVFDTDGKLVQTLELPHTFTPRLPTDSVVYGFGELETGEIVIADVRLD